MDVFPLNLVLAVATAAATIFLGFLPTRNINSRFFGQEAIKAALLWFFIAMASPSAISHYHIFIALLCFGAWWQFRRERALNGKMWLSIASGLGISIGVMLLLAVTPRAYPADLPELNRMLLLASIYLGGGVIGLAYVTYILIQGAATRSGVTSELVQRYAELLLMLAIARAAILWIAIYLQHGFDLLLKGALPVTTGLLLVLAGLLLPLFAFAAWQALGKRATTQAGMILAGLGLMGFLAESLARMLVL